MTKEAKKMEHAEVTLVDTIKDALVFDETNEGLIQAKLDNKLFENSLPEGLDMKAVKAVQKAEQTFVMALEQAVGEKAIELHEKNDKVTGMQASIKLGGSRATARFLGKEDVEGGEPVYGACYLTYRAQASQEIGDLADMRRVLAEKAKKAFG